MAKESQKISIIVPLFNEEDSVGELVAEVTAAMAESGLAYELIMVDDGSTDETAARLEALREAHPQVAIVEFRRNFGQTAAMAAGFDHAGGDVIVPIDGDLQNDPRDIPRVVAKLNEGYDVVSGWRRNRKDRLITRKVPSWIANWLIGKITGVRLHDYGCSLKAYSKEMIDHVNLYGEMHRFIPAIAQWYGARVTEMEVNHRPRRHGKTKYGLTRTMKVVMDLMTVKFLGSFGAKPLHIFGGIGSAAFLGATLAGLAVMYQKWISPGRVDMSDNPLLILTVMLLLMSLQFLFMGLMAEMLARTYHESQDKPIYALRRFLAPRE